MIEAVGLAKTFVLHTQGGARIRVLDGADLRVRAGECVALTGPSGSGKSTLLRSLYANYKVDGGAIRVRIEGGWVDLAAAPPGVILAVRRRVIGYVSQFLRVIPRIPALDVVAEPLLAQGCAPAAAEARARALLARLAIPEALWALAPATFSGGEQQRINVARGFVAAYPILLLDEPTASLDRRNRETVVAMICEAKARGAAIVGIFHDVGVRAAVADRLYPLTPTGESVPCTV